MRFHTSLPVTDIAKTIDFYRVLLGVQPTKTKVDYAKFLWSDGLNISFHTNAKGADELRSLHLGFQLDSQSDLDAAHVRLEAAGLLSSKRETSICCYANQDKFWVKDPDGYEWELYYLVEDTEAKIEPTTACCATDGVASEAMETVASENKQTQTTSCC